MKDKYCHMLLVRIIFKIFPKIFQRKFERAYVPVSKFIMVFVIPQEQWLLV